MADTKSHPTGSAFTESDGINYRGIVVFMVILTVTTLVCEGIVVGLFKYFDAQAVATTAARAPLAVPAGTMPPPPNLVTDEPGTLKKFQATEEETLHTYGWMDKNAGVVRLPIDRAKELLLERGLPAVGDAPAEPAKAQNAKAEIKK
ncbi:MAG: hypothetical protein EPO35_01520 [Acidobacteria bacterium]|nr:MAG: hypothetical protein EPO35_01520 [Acidobacteriota bacterium]